MSCIALVIGLFEQRVDQYLEELPDTEQSGVNKFLKGLGEFCCRQTSLVSNYNSLENVAGFKIIPLEKYFKTFFL